MYVKIMTLTCLVDLCPGLSRGKNLVIDGVIEVWMPLLLAWCTNGCSHWPLHLPKVDVVAFLFQGWEKISSTKKLNRFRPPEVSAAVQKLELARERLRVQAEKDYINFLKSFAALYTPFRSAVSALAALDVLQSLALVSQNSGSASCDFQRALSI